MAIGEQSLYRLAHLLSRTEVAHSSQMKGALTSIAANDRYRSDQAHRVLAAADMFQSQLAGTDILDLGCNDGALTMQYAESGPRSVTGIDIDAAAIDLANSHHCRPHLRYLVSTTTTFPLPDASIDVILCYDVFEHVSQPARVLEECRRVLRPGGTVLIGTWGWGNPFAPHLWSTMPVPWAHLFVSERTLLRACRLVYEADLYAPTFHDLDAEGRRLPGRYRDTSISTDYLNKYRIRDFEQVFAASGMSWELKLVPFGSRWARWTKPLLKSKYLREFLHGYLWAALTKGYASN